MPLALSFVTFQQIAFLVDCYKNNSSLGNHCADFENFKSLQTSGLASPLKFSKNITSNTANIRIVDSLKQPSLECQDSKEAKSTRHCETYDSKSWRAAQSANPHKRKSISPESKADSIQAQEPAQISLNFLDYCLFITFFPQLIAGPIVHHKEMMPQFHAMQKGLHKKRSSTSIEKELLAHKENTLDSGNTHIESTSTIKKETQFLHNKTIEQLSLINWEYIAKGLFIFAIGLFKKVCIADSFAKWANAGFSATQKGEILNFFESWATSLSYTFQLYFDFSGYCDMAIGLGLLFGIVLPLNFNSPYKALNIADFWRRWHITLGRFLKEYVYIPLGGNRNISRSNRICVGSLAKNGDYGGKASVITALGNSLASPCKTPFLSQSSCRDEILATPPKGDSQSRLVAKHDFATIESNETHKRNLESVVGVGDIQGGGLDSACSAANPHLQIQAPPPCKKESLKNEILKTDSESNEAQDYGLPRAASAALAMTKNNDSILNKILTLRNLFIVAFLSGIWHGAGWGFVLWGILHGLAMLTHRIYSFILKPLSAKYKNLQNFLQSRFYKFLCWFLTFNFVNIAWIFFRAENLQGALNLIKGMFGIESVPLKAQWYKVGIMLEHIQGTERTLLYIVLGFIVCLWCKNSFDVVGRAKKVYLLALCASLLFACAILGILLENRPPEFIYFNF